MDGRHPIPRRTIVKQWLAATAGLVLTACGVRTSDEGEPTVPPATPEPPDTLSPGAGQPARGGQGADPTPTEQAVADLPLTPTPQCDDGDETPPQSAGPFFLPDSPERQDLREADGGPPLVVTGRVVDTECRPIAGALLDFWHSDNTGAYDTDGYRYRGHQYADADGRFTLYTIVPARYTGRTRHIHVRVQGEDTPLLTTQLYFPDEPDNARDGLFDPELLMEEVPSTGDDRATRFEFVLKRAST